MMRRMMAYYIIWEIPLVRFELYAHQKSPIFLNNQSGIKNFKTFERWDVLRWLIMDPLGHRSMLSGKDVELAGHPHNRRHTESRDACP